MDEIRVDSVKAYLDKVNEITRQKPGKYIFRGQGKNQDGDTLLPLDCGAARRIRKYLDRPPTNEDLNNYHQKLIYYAKQRRYNIKDGSNLSDMEIIADLQHFGSATMLIDFTKNALVALYFAAIDNQNEDGAVFVMNQEEDTFENGFDAIKENEDNCNPVILWSKLLGKNPNKLFYWEPSSLNQRIPSQHSIFVFGQPEIKTNFLRIVIEAHRNDRYNDKKGKKAITEELDRIFDISAVTLFNDLPGFAWSNRFTEKLDNDFLKFESKDQEKFKNEQLEKQLDEYSKITLDNKNDKYVYFEKGKLNYDLKNYNEAIKYLTEALNKDSKFYNAYFYRALAYSKLSINNDKRNLMIAKDDYEKAIEIDSTDPFAYYNKAIINYKLGKIAEAIEDNTIAIRLDPNLEEAYLNRSDAYLLVDMISEALHDCEEAIKLNPNSSLAYLNRSIAYWQSGNKLKSKYDYEKAKELAKNQKDLYALDELKRCFDSEGNLKPDWKETAE